MCPAQLHRPTAAVQALVERMAVPRSEPGPLCDYQPGVSAIDRRTARRCRNSRTHVLFPPGRHPAVARRPGIRRRDAGTAFPAPDRRSRICVVSLSGGPSAMNDGRQQSESLVSPHPTRREFLQCSLVGGLGLAHQFAAAPQPSDGFCDNRSVVLIVNVGGPSQLDTWDPKPDAPMETRGPFGTIRTTVPGIFLSELCPRQARIAHRLAFVRCVLSRCAGGPPGRLAVGTDGVRLSRGELRSARGPCRRTGVWTAQRPARSRGNLPVVPRVRHRPREARRHRTGGARTVACPGAVWLVAIRPGLSLGALPGRGGCTVRHGLHLRRLLRTGIVGRSWRAAFCHGGKHAQYGRAHV